MLPKRFFDIIVITKSEWENFKKNNKYAKTPQERWYYLTYSNIGNRLLFSKNRLHCGLTKVNKQLNEWNKFFSIYRKLIEKPILITYCVIPIPDEMLKKDTDLPQE